MQILNGLQPGLFAPNAADDTATAAAKQMVRHILCNYQGHIAAVQRCLRP